MGRDRSFGGLVRQSKSNPESGWEVLAPAGRGTGKRGSKHTLCSCSWRITNPNCPIDGTEAKKQAKKQASCKHSKFTTISKRKNRDKSVTETRQCNSCNMSATVVVSVAPTVNARGWLS